MIDILVPIAYSFPNIGKLTVMLFVLFAGWFAGKPISPEALPALAFSGLLALFGDVYVAIPFMLDLVRLPSDLFQFFVMSGFLTGKFSSMVAVMNLFALTLIAISLFLGKLRYSLFQLLKLTGGLAAVVVTTLIITKVGLHYIIDTDKRTDEIIANLRVADSVPISVSRDFPSGKTSKQTIASLKEIKERGVLRVGYRPSNVPFSYYNNAADLVGFDVEIATKLAEDLKVGIEFIPFRKDHIASGLDQGSFDIAMSGLVMNADLLQKVNFSSTVVALTRSLVVADHRVKDFDSREKILASKETVVAYVEDDALIAKARDNFPKATFVAIENYNLFFKQKPGSFDALFISAEAGSAWTLFYPDYGVSVYDRRARYPSAYAIAWDNTDLLRYVDNWVKLKKIDGTIDIAYNRWILGVVDKSAEKRWSIAKDVLGWLD